MVFLPPPNFLHLEVRKNFGAKAVNGNLDSCEKLTASKATEKNAEVNPIVLFFSKSSDKTEEEESGSELGSSSGKSPPPRCKSTRLPRKQPLTCRPKTKSSSRTHKPRMKRPNESSSRKLKAESSSSYNSIYPPTKRAKDSIPGRIQVKSYYRRFPMKRKAGSESFMDRSLSQSSYSKAPKLAKHSGGSRGHKKPKTNSKYGTRSGNSNNASRKGTSKSHYQSLQKPKKGKWIFKNN